MRTSSAQTTQETTARCHAHLLRLPHATRLEVHLGMSQQVPLVRLLLHKQLLQSLVLQALPPRLTNARKASDRWLAGLHHLQQCHHL